MLDRYTSPPSNRGLESSLNGLHRHSPQFTDHRSDYQDLDWSTRMEFQNASYGNHRVDFSGTYRPLDASEDAEHAPTDPSPTDNRTRAKKRVYIPCSCNHMKLMEVLDAAQLWWSSQSSYPSPLHYSSSSCFPTSWTRGTCPFSSVFSMSPTQNHGEYNLLVFLYDDHPSGYCCALQPSSTSSL